MARLFFRWLSILPSVTYDALLRVMSQTPTVRAIAEALDSPPNLITPAGTSATSRPPDSGESCMRFQETILMAKSACIWGVGSCWCDVRSPRALETPLLELREEMLGSWNEASHRYEVLPQTSQCNRPDIAVSYTDITVSYTDITVPYTTVTVSYTRHHCIIHSHHFIIHQT